MQKLFLHWTCSIVQLYIVCSTSTVVAPAYELDLEPINQTAISLLLGLARNNESSQTKHCVEVWGHPWAFRDPAQHFTCTSFTSSYRKQPSRNTVCVMNLCSTQASKWKGWLSSPLEAGDVRLSGCFQLLPTSQNSGPLCWHLAPNSEEFLAVGPTDTASPLLSLRIPIITDWKSTRLNSSHL